MLGPKNILFYGDSLTWGWMPVLEGAPSYRFPYDQRLAGIMAAELGDGFHIVEEGLSGRTTSVDDPNDPRLNGSTYLPAALASHLPLDLVIVMLGTNDTKSIFNRTPFEIANGMAKLVGQIASSAGGVGTPYPAPKTLVVAPPPLVPMPHPHFQGMFGGGHEKSAELGAHYRNMADFMKVDFLNAGDVITTDGVDGLHLTAQNNADLGKAIANKVHDILNG
ncbi:MAG: SGNH/GDSL hydrolase family protein [Hyphomicrobiales bacterium]